MISRKISITKAQKSTKINQKAASLLNLLIEETQGKTRVYAITC
jgi:hypothetical protein